MKRRSFIKGTTTAISGLGISGTSYANSDNKKIDKISKICATLDQQKVSFFADIINEPVKVVHIADTHLFMDDERGIQFQEYSNRMSKAYNQTTHFQTREKTNPKISFEQTLEFAKDVNADVINLVGDIFSFPSEAGIEWVLSKLNASGIPYIYIAGNHDWHYEGMKGSLEFLRQTWIEKRLYPLYQGNHPLMAAYDIKGIRFLAIDNSTYQINEEQLAFLSSQIRTGLPLVLLIHIPMYAPGKNISFGCGNPFWGAATDQGFELERRPKWPVSGHTQITFDFYKKVFDAPNIMGVFAGHTHRNSIEIIKGKPQIISDDNASGGYLEIDFLPLKEQHKKVI